MYKRQLLICHKNPDGDTIGSAAALYWALKGPVSYTHLDVYKRQMRGRRVAAHLIRATAAGEKDVAGILQGKDLSLIHI